MSGPIGSWKYVGKARKEKKLIKAMYHDEEDVPFRGRKKKKNSEARFLITPHVEPMYTNDKGNYQYTIGQYESNGGYYNFSIITRRLCKGKHFGKWYPLNFFEIDWQNLFAYSYNSKEEALNGINEEAASRGWIKIQ